MFTDDQRLPAAGELFVNRRLGIVELVGDPALVVKRPSPLDKVGVGCLAFARSIDRLIGLGDALAGAVVICAPFDTKEIDVKDWPCTLLLAENPRLAFMRAVATYFAPTLPSGGIHPSAIVHDTAQIDETAHIGAYCCIGADARIGPRTTLHPHVVIYDRVIIGADCRINSGTVIGADGFGYERNETGELEKFPHIGGVVIGDEVEIGSNTSIDRGSLGDTVIEDRARIDNLVHISHNVRVGEDAAVIAQTMLGGSVSVGKGAWIAPGAIVMNQMAVGAKATVGLGAVVVKTVADDQTVMGAPAQDSAEFKASRAALARLVNG